MVITATVVGTLYLDLVSDCTRDATIVILTNVLRRCALRHVEWPPSQFLISFVVPVKIGVVGVAAKVPSP